MGVTVTGGDEAKAHGRRLDKRKAATNLHDHIIEARVADEREVARREQIHERRRQSQLILDSTPIKAVRGAREPFQRPAAGEPGSPRAWKKLDPTGVAGCGRYGSRVWVDFWWLKEEFS